MKDILKYAKLNSEGKLDVDATTAAIREDVVKSWEKEINLFAAIEKHMGAIFSEHPGLRANVGYCVGETLRRMGTEFVSPENWTEVDEKVRHYLKSASGEGGKFVVAKGKSGGVTLAKKAE